jgi:hypothetical protein
MVWVPDDSRGREIEGRIRGEIVVFNPTSAVFISFVRRHQSLGHHLTIFDQPEAITRTRRGRYWLVLIPTMPGRCFAHNTPPNRLPVGAILKANG